jgi:membrane-associated phospholipid phosphatase
MSQRTELLIVSAVAVLLIATGASLLCLAPHVDARASLAVAKTVRATVLEPILVRATHLGDVWVWIAVATLILWSGELEAGLSLGAALLGSFLTPLLKAAVAIPRPPTNLTSSVRTGGFSFPSGHAQVSAAVASIVGGGRRPGARALLFTVALIVALSRVALGVHRLSDVLTGLGLGLLVGAGAAPIARAWMSLSTATRLRWIPAGPLFTGAALLFGPATFDNAAAAAGGFLLGACLPPLYGLRDIRREFSWRTLLVRAGIGALGTTCLLAVHVAAGSTPVTAGLFGLWVTCLAPAAFRAAEADAS